MLQKSPSRRLILKERSSLFCSTNVAPLSGFEPANCGFLYRYPKNRRMAKHLGDKTDRLKARQKCSEELAAIPWIQLKITGYLPHSLQRVVRCWLLISDAKRSMPPRNTPQPRRESWRRKPGNSRPIPHRMAFLASQSGYMR